MRGSTVIAAGTPSSARPPWLDVNRIDAALDRLHRSDRRHHALHDNRKSGLLFDPQHVVPIEIDFAPAHDLRGFDGIGFVQRRVAFAERHWNAEIVADIVVPRIGQCRIDRRHDGADILRPWRAVMTSRA